MVRVVLRDYINRELKKLGKIEVPKIIETTNYITGRIRISKENRDLIFIEGFGLVQKIKDIP